MIKLNLATNCVEHDALKEYLEENVSVTLAKKINNGVIIEKDGKKLLNKKDLNGFIIYACNEAKKLAAKGATSTCVKSDIVFGWLIHFFEEDSIEGKLYNEDGTEYRPIQKEIQRIPAPSIPAKPTPPKPQQFTLFDMLTEEKKEEDPVVEETPPLVEEPIPESQESNTEEPLFDEEDIDRETGEILRFKTPESKRGSPLYQKYIQVQNQYSQAVIAYRLGDFFEVFGNNAVNVANRMELTLTGRDCGLPERVPMVGFPYHISDTYFKKIAQFSPLVVVDNNEVTPYALEEETTNETPVTKENEHTMYENIDVIDDFEEERALQKFFDKDALCALYELFDYNLDMQ